MRRLFGWAAGIVSVAALARLLGRRRRDQAATETPVDPAEELRRKLDDARTSTPARGPDAAPAGEPSEPETAAGTVNDAGSEGTPETLEERRARVHAKAQEALEAMRGGGDQI